MVFFNNNKKCLSATAKFRRLVFQIKSFSKGRCAKIQYSVGCSCGKASGRINCAWKTDGSWFPWRGYDKYDIAGCDQVCPQVSQWEHFIIERRLWYHWFLLGDARVPSVAASAPEQLAALRGPRLPQVLHRAPPPQEDPAVDTGRHAGPWPGPSAEVLGI